MYPLRCLRVPQVEYRCFRRQRRVVEANTHIQYMCYSEI
jgi:hypothetical protein